MESVGPFTGRNRYLIITVNRVTEDQGFMASAFGYGCEYCEGTVRPRCLEREAFKHRTGFVILENVTIGVCDRCGSRYYAAATVRRVHDLATGRIARDRIERVPVDRDVRAKATARA